MATNQIVLFQSSDRLCDFSSTSSFPIYRDADHETAEGLHCFFSLIFVWSEIWLP